MNGHSLHLAINHFPIILAIVGAAAMLVAFISRRRAVLLYAMTTMMAAGASVYPAQWSGERAEDAVESRWFVEKEAIHAHEESSERTTWILILGGFAAAVGTYLVIRSPREATPGMTMLTTMLLLSVSGAVAAGFTGWQGGAIVSRNVRLSQPADSASADVHDGH